MFLLLPFYNDRHTKSALFSPKQNKNKNKGLYLCTYSISAFQMFYYLNEKGINLKASDKNLMKNMKDKSYTRVTWINKTLYHLLDKTHSEGFFCISNNKQKQNKTKNNALNKPLSYFAFCKKSSRIILNEVYRIRARYLIHFWQNATDGSFSFHTRQHFSTNIQKFFQVQILSRHSERQVTNNYIQNWWIRNYGSTGLTV